MRVSVPRGLVSVIPHAWIISMPRVSQYQRISEGGGADPPQVRCRSFERSQRSGSASMALRTLCQMVGTPAEIVTSSDSKRSRRLAASRKRWGITCLAPSIMAAKGRPQPMAWNMGTMPQALSRPESPMASVIASVMVCR